MKCPNCGKEIPDKSLFCNYCGFQITTIQTELTDDERKIASPENHDKHNSMEKKPKSVKKAIIIGCAAVSFALIAGLAIYFLVIKSKPMTTPDQKNIVASAYLSDDGGYIPLAEENSIKITDSIKSAFLTPDKQHLVACQKDGKLYVTNSEQNEKTEIANNCYSISKSNIRNDGFVYSDKNGNHYRILFSDYSSLLIPTSSDSILNYGLYEVCDSSITLSYTYDNAIYFLKNTDTTPKKIVDSKSSVFGIVSVTDDSNIIYEEADNETSKVFTLNENYEGETQQLDSVFSDYGLRLPTVFVEKSKDQKMIVIGCENTNKVWIINDGAKPVEADLPAGSHMYSSKQIFTEKGNLVDCNSDEVYSIYVELIDEDYKNSIYNIYLTGNGKQTVTSIGKAVINNRKISYTSNNTLYYADIKDGDLQNEIKVDDNVSDFLLSNNNEYLYYVKNVADSSKEHHVYGYTGVVYSGELYCKKLNAKAESTLVADTIDGTESYNFGLKCSFDGETVYYFQNLDEIKSDKQQGELLKWTYDEKKSQNIGSGVIFDSIIDWYTTGEINNNDFVYMQYVSLQKAAKDSYDSDKVTEDIIEYNGKDNNHLFDNVIE